MYRRAEEVGPTVGLSRPTQVIKYHGYSKKPPYFSRLDYVYLDTENLFSSKHPGEGESMKCTTFVQHFEIHWDMDIPQPRSQNTTQRFRVGVKLGYFIAKMGQLW